jgi:hypothetical protein
LGDGVDDGVQICRDLEALLAVIHQHSRAR